MKKIVSPYEEKSKLIEEIQRSLRKPKHSNHSRYQHYTLSFDLPTILDRKPSQNKSYSDKIPPSISKELSTKNPTLK